MNPIKIEQKDVAGAIVLYNSPIETLDNVITYIDQIEKLYVIDNSVTPNEKLITILLSYPKIQYVSLYGNKGIAIALNWAATQAIRDGYKVLLTMDDDTKTPDKMISQMIDFWNLYNHPIGILSGVHHSRVDVIPFRKLLYTLTSGNLLNLAAYDKIKGFRDDLFIDHVDHEYGLRLNKFGYQVVELPFIRLDHKLGYNQQIKFGNRVLSYGTHPPIRLYYFARNGIYVACIYFKTNPLFALSVIKEIFKRFIKAGLLDKMRLIRIKMIIKGIKDGLNGHLGQYSQLH